MKQKISKGLYVSCLLGSYLYAQAIDQKTFSRVFKQVKLSAVTIVVSATEIVGGQPKTVEGGGSGVIISIDGLIVTNKHVVSDKTRTFKIILSNGEEVRASFVGMAPDTDLSIIKLDAIPRGGINPISLGDSDKIEEGDWVLAIGSPFGLGGTLTAGIVSTKERTVPIPDENGNTMPHSLIQTDATINPGNSGGALVNLNGELIGVPTMILSRTGTSAGIGFAIPSNVVKKVLSDITSKKVFSDVGWLGVLVQGVDGLGAGIKKQLGIEIDIQNGVIATALELGGPAEKAGIKQSDVILGINGQVIKNVKDFQWAERNLSPGEAVVIKIKRRNSPETQEIKVVVGKLIKQKTGQD